MSFWEAIDVLQEGKKIKPRHISDIYFYLDDKNIIRDNSHKIYGYYRFLHGFYFDTNIEWEIYKNN